MGERLTKGKTNVGKGRTLERKNDKEKADGRGISRTLCATD